MKTKIAIVGASIAGSICSIILERLGFNITVFEKSKSNESIVDRGAGIWLPETLIRALIDKNILSSDFPYINIHERPIYTYDAKQNREHLLTSHHISSAAVNWMNLYEDLRKYRPETKIIYNAQVTQIEQNQQERIKLVVNEQQHHDFDYCLFTDGVHSIGRRYVFPTMQPTFANTIIWRGTLDNADEESVARLLGKGIFYVCERGHLLMYLIPNQNNKGTEKKYKVNWLYYEMIDATHDLFQGDTKKASQNVIKGTMSATYRDYLHTAAQKYFPDFPRRIILTTEQPFIQAIHEMLIPSYVAGNIGLIGDAGILLRPHTAVGATKAIQDALALGEQLTINTDIKSAVKTWNENQYLFGKKQFKLGQALGELFVTHMPDWQRTSKQQIDEMWQTTSANVCWYAA